VDLRSGLHHAVEVDGDLLLIVLLGDGIPLARALAGGRELNLPLAGLVDGRIGRRQGLAGELGGPELVAHSLVLVGEDHRRAGVVLLRRRGLDRRLTGGSGGLVERQRLEDRAEKQLGRAADDLQGPLLVLDAGELDDDVVALLSDLGLGNAQAVDAVADDLDGRLEVFALRLGLGLEHNRRSALEIETQVGRVAEGDGRRQGAYGDQNDDDERDDEPAAHGSAWAGRRTTWRRGRRLPGRWRLGGRRLGGRRLGRRRR